ncbi:MAG TPA: hypothetical protein VD770_01985 [Coxiellaceae bacterium]|nr:hypothetical protein [Coxiellaceae bacterium]
MSRDQPKLVASTGETNYALDLVSAEDMGGTTTPVVTPAVQAPLPERASLPLKFPIMVAVREDSKALQTELGKKPYYKIVFLGDADGSKSKLVNLLAESESRPLYMEWVGAFVEKPGETEKINCRLYDTAGTERLRYTPDYFFRSANAVFIMGTREKPPVVWEEECRKKLPDSTLYTLHYSVDGSEVSLRPWSTKNLEAAFDQTFIPSRACNRLGNKMLAEVVAHFSREPELIAAPTSSARLFGSSRDSSSATPPTTTASSPAWFGR